MSKKMSDLQHVLAAFPLSALISAEATPDEHYVQGRFTNHDGKGCLLFHLSAGRISNRPAFVSFCAQNPEVDAAACKRVIAAYDTGATSIDKGEGFDKFYPKPTYRLTLSEFREAVREEIAQRHAAISDKNEQLELVCG
jgi:hypothetical protein